MHNSTDALSGTVHHIKRNNAGGALLTPIALYFVTRPEFVEGFNSHWRLDYFSRVHKLSPEPANAGEELVRALFREGLCFEPLWLSIHKSEELSGKAFGEVFEDE